MQRQLVQANSEARIVKDRPPRIRALDALGGGGSVEVIPSDKARGREMEPVAFEVLGACRTIPGRRGKLLSCRVLRSRIHTFAVCVSRVETNATLLPSGDSTA